VIAFANVLLSVWTWACSVFVCWWCILINYHIHTYIYNLVGGLEHSLFFLIMEIIPTDFHIFQRGWNHQPVIHSLVDRILYSPTFWRMHLFVWPHTAK
jgi:hypothetical protein